LYTYAGSGADRFGWCFVLSAFFLIVCCGITVFIRDDEEGLACGPCLVCVGRTESIASMSGLITGGAVSKVRLCSRASCMLYRAWSSLRAWILACCRHAGHTRVLTVVNCNGSCERALQHLQGDGVGDAAVSKVPAAAEGKAVSPPRTEAIVREPTQHAGRFEERPSAGDTLDETALSGQASLHESLPLPPAELLLHFPDGESGSLNLPSSRHVYKPLLASGAPEHSQAV
jgi:hypothetical protein